MSSAPSPSGSWPVQAPHVRKSVAVCVGALERRQEAAVVETVAGQVFFAGRRGGDRTDVVAVTAGQRTLAVDARLLDEEGLVLLQALVLVDATAQEAVAIEIELGTP